MHHEHHYRSFGLMIALSFVAMYILMYAMVDSVGNVFPNHNQFYMAGLMTAPMILLELIFMRGMYGNKKLNITIIGFALALFIFCLVGIREQVAIDDEQFLKSMIPHHAGAVLMCNKAHLTDPEIQQLCAGIISGQQTEIDFMKSKLDALQ